MNVSNKVVVASSTATVLAGAFCTVVLWYVKARYQIEVPADVKDALVVVLGALGTGVLTVLAGWLQREQNPSPSGTATVEARLEAKGWKPPRG